MNTMIPLYPGVRGYLDDALFSKDGNATIGSPKWLTPMQVVTPDGLPVSVMRIVPHLAYYVQPVKFEVWDKLNRFKPKKVAVVYIDPKDNSYYVEVEPYYMTKRLVLELSSWAERQPDELVAYINKTMYGDWRYKDVI